MDAEDALRFVDDLFREHGERPLNDLQRNVFRGSWHGKGYKEIHQDCVQRGHDIGRDHLMRNVGPKLWKLLSQVASDFAENSVEIRKEALKGPIEELHRLRTQTIPLVNPFFSTESAPPDFPELGSIEDLFNPERCDPKWDWEQAPDAQWLYGRTKELDELQQWIATDGCRVITLYGFAGIGKTAIAVKIAEQVRDKFEFIIWRSLSRSALQTQPPTIPELLADLIQFFSDKKDDSADLATFLSYLRDNRCLIVLDGLEAVFEGGRLSGEYAPGYEAYGDFLRRVGESHHQSCVIVTSREKPKSLDRLEGARRLVRSQRVQGLRMAEAQTLFTECESFRASETDWQHLFWRYNGNPLFLQQVATTIADAFAGDVSSFLNYQKAQAVLVGDIRQVLDQQLARLSRSEITLIHTLAQYQQPATLQEMMQLVEANRIREPMPEPLLDILLSLVRRSLLDVNAGVYSLPPLLVEHVSKTLVAT